MELPTSASGPRAVQPRNTAVAPNSDLILARGQSGAAVRYGLYGLYCTALYCTVHERKRKRERKRERKRTRPPPSKT
jgi:hypothetical protein